ncbi:MAG: hypothetical protein HC831_20210 [Chloroflexia bacterium]|nr:hypothetical protein [Bacteroidales bacterium]NJO91026.1 hypothetical protein [Chloroflexia bacterium]
MKTKIISSVALIFFLINIEAQNNRFINKSQLIDFFKSTTYVVMDNNPSVGFNIFIKDAMQKYWTVTPYKIISHKEFDDMRKDNKNSFMFLSVENLKKGDTDAFYDYLVLAMGDTATVLTNMPEIVNIPLSYSGVDENEYVNKIGLIIRFIEYHLGNMKEASNHVYLRKLNYYNKNIKEIKNKTLLIEEEDLAEEVNSVEKIKAIYKYDVKIVSSDDIEKAVEEKTPNTLVLHQISPGEDDNEGRSYHYILGTDDAKMYYFNFFTISEKKPSGFLARDFKRLSLGL